MSTSVSNYLHRVQSTPPADAHSLPDSGFSDTWNPPLVDRIGMSVAYRPLVVIGGAVAGATGAVGLLMKMGRGGIFSRTAAGLVGAIAGAGLIAWGASKLFDHGTSPIKSTVPARDTVTKHEKLKVMTYNIRGSMGPTGYGTDAKDLDALAAAVRKQDPDILVMQEIDRSSLRSNHKDVLTELSKRLHPNDAYSVGTGRLITGRSQDVGIMTFHGAHVQDARGIAVDDPRGSGVVRRFRGWLDDARNMLKAVPPHKDIHFPGHMKSYSPAGTMDALVRTAGGNDIRILTGHYEATTDDNINMQAEQVEPIVATIGKWKGPTIFAGDVNTASDGERGEWERNVFGSVGLTDTFTAVGVPPGDKRRISSPNDQHEIDRIYVSPQFHATDTHVVRERPLTADHDPVVATLDL